MNNFLDIVKDILYGPEYYAAKRIDRDLQDAMAEVARNQREFTLRTLGVSDNTNKRYCYNCGGDIKADSVWDCCPFCTAQINAETKYE